MSAAAADDDRSRHEREFAEFRAETRLQISHLREMLAKVIPLHEARSGDQAVIAEVRSDIHSIQSSMSVLGTKVDTIKDAQTKWMAVVVALQILGGFILWLIQTGVIQVGNTP